MKSKYNENLTNRNQILSQVNSSHQQISGFTSYQDQVKDREIEMLNRLQFEAIDEISDSENVGSGSHSNRFDEGLIESDSKYNGGGGGVSAKRIFKSAERSFRL